MISIRCYYLLSFKISHLMILDGRVCGCKSSCYNCLQQFYILNHKFECGWPSHYCLQPKSMFFNKKWSVKIELTHEKLILKDF